MLTLATVGGASFVTGDVGVVVAGALTVAVLMRREKYPHRTILRRKLAPRRFPP